MSDLENGVGFLETEVSEIKHDIGEIRATKADFEYVNELRRNVVDLVNRSKLNNVILHGIPEGEGLRRTEHKIASHTPASSLSLI